MKQQEILEKTSIINVKNKLNLKETFSTKDTIFVKCPFCSDNGAMKLNTTENSYGPISFAPSGKQVDVSSVREVDGNGSSYMTKGTTSDTFNTKLNEVTQIVSDALETAKSAASNSGFLSSQNEGTLQQSLATISNNFNEMMSNIRTEFNTAMNAKEDQYKATETSVNESMSL